MAINQQPNVEVHRIGYNVRGPEWAFAVPRGDREALAEVMALCSHFWNGAGSLIIPVRSDGRLPPYLNWLTEVREIEQVFMHEALGERAQAAVTSRFASGRIYDGMLDGEIHPLYLSLNDRPESERKICLPAVSSKRLERIALALWGEIPQEDLEDWRERYAVSEAEGAEAIGELLAGQINGRSPLELGTRHMETIEQRGGMGPPMLYAIGPGSFEELVIFWNVRSRLGRQVGISPILGVPREALEEKSLRPVIEWIESRRYGTYDKPDVSVVGKDRERAALRSALRRIGFRRAPRDGRYRHSFPNPPEGRENLEYRDAAPVVSGPLKRGKAGSAVITFSERRALLELPSPEGMRLPWGYVRLSITGLPLALPMNAATAAGLIPNAGVTQDGMRIKTDSGRQTWSWELRLPDEGESLEQWASARDYSVEPSQPGRFGLALLNRLDALEELDALASEPALQILTELAPRSTKRLAQRIAVEVERRGLSEAAIDEEVLAGLLRHQGLSLEIEAKSLQTIGSACGANKRELLGALGALVEAGLVRRGTKLLCERCNFTHTFSLAESDEWFECRTCGERLANPVASGREEHPRSYYLDGLAAQLVEQGMVPVILALRRAQITNPEGKAFFAWPGLLFRRGEEQPRDGDLVASDGELVKIFECKTRAEALDMEQVEKLIALCERVEARPGIAAPEGTFTEQIADATREAGGEVWERAELLAER